MIVSNKTYLNDLFNKDTEENEDNMFNEFNVKIWLKSPIVKKKDFNVLELPSSNKYNNIKFILNSNSKAKNNNSDNSTIEDEGSIKINLMDKFNSIENNRSSKLTNLINFANNSDNYFENYDSKVNWSSFISNEDKIDSFIEDFKKYLTLN